MSPSASVGGSIYNRTHERHPADLDPAALLAAARLGAGVVRERRLVVMAGGGVREENVGEIIDRASVREVHVRLTRLTRGDGPPLYPGVKVRKALPDDEAAWEENGPGSSLRLGRETRPHDGP